MLAVLDQSLALPALSLLRVFSVVVLFPTAKVTKAMITLQPPWVAIFQKEKVTLWCEGPHLPGDSATQWFIHSTLLQISTPRHSITKATFKDSGEYGCRTGLSMPSDPVQLEIHRSKHGMGRRAGDPKVSLCVGARVLSVSLSL